MRFDLAPLIAGAALLLAGCATRPAALAAADTPALQSQAYGEPNPARARTLIVILHGDADSGIASADSFAQVAAAELPGSTAIALLRPGYVDGKGRRSPGERGLTNGDGYTRERVGEVARSLIDLRSRYRRARLILVGEGGGAALAANLVGIYPTLADGLLLASCPCALPEWRREMAKLEPDARFGEPVASLDPLQTIGGVPSGIRAAILVAGKGPPGLARYSRTYAEALALRGIAVDFRILPDRGTENILADPQVSEVLKRLADPQTKARK